MGRKSGSKVRGYLVVKSAVSSRSVELVEESAAALAIVQDAFMVTRRARTLALQVEAVNKRRREIIIELIGMGLRQSEVARMLDISRQRITQYVDEMRAAGELPPAGDC